MRRSAALMTLFPALLFTMACQQADIYTCPEPAALRGQAMALLASQIVDGQLNCLYLTDVQPITLAIPLPPDKSCHMQERGTVTCR